MQLPLAVGLSHLLRIAYDTADQANVVCLQQAAQISAYGAADDHLYAEFQQ
jgi:hypothetical protein